MFATISAEEKQKFKNDAVELRDSVFTTFGKSGKLLNTTRKIGCKEIHRHIVDNSYRLKKGINNKFPDVKKGIDNKMVVVREASQDGLHNLKGSVADGATRVRNVSHEFIKRAPQRFENAKLASVNSFRNVKESSINQYKNIFERKPAEPIIEKRTGRNK